MTGGNLPLGVTSGMIPGDRPEDDHWEQVHRDLDEIAEDHGLDAAGGEIRVLLASEALDAITEAVHAFFTPLSDPVERRQREAAALAGLRAVRDRQYTMQIQWEEEERFPVRTERRARCPLCRTTTEQFRTAQDAAWICRSCRRGNGVEVVP